MDQDRLSSIRQAEKESHLAAYATHELYAAGSWLEKPVKTVLDLVPLFDGYENIRVLDLGCGVGRNAIAVARAFSGVACTVDCVDILEDAIERLERNAAHHQVAESIRGIVCPLDEFEIGRGSYDMILSISALEHMDSEESFVRKLEEIRNGLREGGVFSLIINSNVAEQDASTGETHPAQFEVDLRTDALKELLGRTFSGWEILKETVVHQSYDIPRAFGMAHLQTDVVTWVVRKAVANLC